MNTKPQSQEKDPKDKRTFKERALEAAKRAGEAIGRGDHPEQGIKPTLVFNELIHHPWALMRLEWMQDNSPDLLREQYQEGTLKEKIEKNVEWAMNHRDLLINKQQVDQEVAKELAQELIAPADEMSLDDLEPMPSKEFQKIVNDLLGEE